MEDDTTRREPLTAAQVERHRKVLENGIFEMVKKFEEITGAEVAEIKREAVQISVTLLQKG